MKWEEFMKAQVNESKLPDINKILIREQEKLDMSIASIASKHRKEEEYKQDILQTLKNIESNTMGLNEIIGLLSDNLGKQDEILDLLKESLSIGASESREEAEGKWRKLMRRTNELTVDVETIQKIQGFANTVLHLFINTGV